MKYTLITLLSLTALAACSEAEPEIKSNSESYKGTGTIIQGEAEVQQASLFSCKNGKSRMSPIGVKTAGGKSYTVPATITYEAKYFASDLYNECSGVTPSSLADASLADVPVIEVDKDGEVVTAYIFGDNYFELYVNGQLIGVDPIPFTPFNSNVVKFKVSKPYDVAIKVVDWEEHSGLGSENNRGKNFHPGDGGFIASFSDGTVTNADWYAQTYYTAPILDLNCLEEVGVKRISEKCSTAGRDDSSQAYSVNWDLPTNWKTGDEYLTWPQATVFSEDEIGVNNKKSYMNFREKFAGAGASFIWSTNVVLDNLTLLRHRVK